MSDQDDDKPVSDGAIMFGWSIVIFFCGSGIIVGS